MFKILVIHGAGIEQRGLVDVALFGTATMDDYSAQIRQYAQALGLVVDIVHSLDWREIAAKLARCRSEGVAGIVINPANFTRGHSELGQALQGCALPTVELHVSNPARRAVVSELTSSVGSVVAGFGLQGYQLALLGLSSLLEAASSTAGPVTL